MENPSKAKVALTFALYQGASLIRRETVAADMVKIGRDARSHVRIDDPGVGAMHATIEVASLRELTLIDLGHESGTLLNGQRINKSKVRVKDQIQIGSVRIVVEKVEAATAGAGRPAPPVPGLSSATVAAAVTSDREGAPVSVPTLAVQAPPPPSPSANMPIPPSVVPGDNPFRGANAPAANPFASPGLFGGTAAPLAANPFSTASPFAPVGPVAEIVDPHAPPGTYTYKFGKNGPEVSAAEVEYADVAALEVTVLWDTNTLQVTQLSPPRAYFVGEKSSKEAPCDYVVPSDAIGATRAPIVSMNGSRAMLVIVPRATGWIEVPGEGKTALKDAVATGKASPSAALAGAFEVELKPGSKAQLELPGGLSFRVSTVNAGKPPVVGMFSSLDVMATACITMSFLLHVGVIASLAFFIPTMHGDDSEGIDRDQILMMQKLLNAAAEREQEDKPVEEAPSEDKAGGSGTRSKGDEGKMGAETSKESGKRFGVQGPQDNADPHVARQAAMKEAAEFGMIGLLNVGAGGDPNAPTAPWGREESLGSDPTSAKGNMFGDSIGEAGGAGGLGLSGVGEGGGGSGEGIGLGGIGTIGHGSGGGTGSGFGSGHGRLPGSHQAKAPTVRQGNTQVNGRLPQEVIQRIVRQNFGRFRLCYENGLRGNPSLQGRVAVKFVIDRTGSVSTASDGGSDIPDQSVISCVTRGFTNLSFPQPEGGIVTVVYPIIFNPGD